MNQPSSRPCVTVTWRALGSTCSARNHLRPRSALWDMPNVLITPHYPNVQGWERETIQRFVENAERFLDRRPLRYVVDKRRGY